MRTCQAGTAQLPPGARRAMMEQRPFQTILQWTVSLPRIGCRRSSSPSVSCLIIIFCPADKPSLSWFLFLTSIVGFYRVKRWEQYIRNPAPPPTPDQLERDRNVRQTLEQVFGIAMLSDQERAAAAAQVEEDERLARDLRSAGLL